MGKKLTTMRIEEDIWASVAKICRAMVPKKSKTAFTEEALCEKIAREEKRLWKKGVGK